MYIYIPNYSWSIPMKQLLLVSYVPSIKSSSSLSSSSPFAHHFCSFWRFDWSSLLLYIHIYIYVCVYIYIYIYICLHMYVYIYVFTYIGLHTHIYIHMFTYAYIYILSPSSPWYPHEITSWRGASRRNRDTSAAPGGGARAAPLSRRGLGQGHGPSERYRIGLWFSGIYSRFNGIYRVV